MKYSFILLATSILFLFATPPLADDSAPADGHALLYARAAQGEAAAQYEIGEAYMKGNGVRTDSETAKGWFLKAAKSNHVAAQVKLAGIYELREKNAEEAKKWYRRAAEQGSTVAQCRLGRLHQYRKDADYVEAARWYRMAAEQGDIGAQRSLGYIYTIPSTKLGDKHKQDYAESLKWYRMAAEQGDALSQKAVARYYASGRGTKKDPEEALRWHERAAAQKAKGAVEEIGDLHRSMGLREEKDSPERLRHLRLAEEYHRKASGLDDIPLPLLCLPACVALLLGWAQRKRLLPFLSWLSEIRHPHTTFLTPERKIDWLRTYWNIFRYILIFCFCIFWTYCFVQYGPLIGLLLGWLPSAAAAFATALLWPLAGVAGLLLILTVEVL